MRRRALLLSVLLGVAPLVGAASGGVTASFRYSLANFSGPVPSHWARLAVDRERGEVYALNQRQNDIRVFDDHGMEIYAFGDGFANAADITIGRHGDIFLLTTGYRTSSVQLLNYRGEHVSEIPLQNVPEEFSDFVADQIQYAGRSLYLVDTDRLLVVVVDERGYFERAHDLKAALRPVLSPEDRVQRPLQPYDRQKRQLDNLVLTGFTADEEGNVFFTVAVLFSAFKLTPDGEILGFGRPGSGPGKFGVAAGIALDESGYIYVSDRLRSVVLIFGPDLQFRAEFGYRGDRPSNLIVPNDLAIDASGYLYVGQAANRGVSVFEVIHETAGLPKHEQDIDPSSPSSATEAQTRPVEPVQEVFLPARAEFTVDYGDPSEEMGE